MREEEKREERREGKQTKREDSRGTERPKEESTQCVAKRAELYSNPEPEEAKPSP